MTLENVTSAVLDGKRARLLRKNAKIANWLGGRDSNPDNMLQRHASYRWTTSQYQPTCSEGTELPIIAAPKRERQATGAVKLGGRVGCGAMTTCGPETQDTSPVHRRAPARG